MPKVIINFHTCLPPFPFLIWNKAAVRKVLEHFDIDPDGELIQTALSDGSVEYSQGETNASSIESTAIRYGSCGGDKERKNSDE